MKVRSVGILFFSWALSLSANVIWQKQLQDRKYDLITVRGSELPTLLGQPLSQFAVMAEKGGVLYPILFQIDKKKGDDYLLEEPPDAVLEEGDELLFYARDAGGAVTSDLLPKETAAHVEISLRDSKTFQRAWVYVLVLAPPGKAPRVSEDEVRYDPSTETVYARDYKMHFSAKAPIGFDALQPALSTGGYARNPVDRLKIRFHARLRAFGIGLSKNEEDFKTVLLGYKDGPLRVIRKIESRLTFFGLFESPEAVSYQKFYGEFLEVPFAVKLPFDVNKAFSSASMAVITEMRRGGKARYYNEKNPQGVLMDGKWEKEEQQLDLSAFSWAVIESLSSGIPGAWLNRIFLPKGQENDFELYYRDDGEVLDPPENDPGIYGSVGYLLPHFEKLERGKYEVSSLLYYMEHYDSKTVREILQTVDDPLKLWFSHAVPWKSD